MAHLESCSSAARQETTPAGCKSQATGELAHFQPAGPKSLLVETPAYSCTWPSPCTRTDLKDRLCCWVSKAMCLLQLSCVMHFLSSMQFCRRSS
jgi:hypothetical protein